MGNSLIEMFLSRFEQFAGRSLTRRGFMKAQGVGTILLAGASSGIITPGVLRAASPPDVGVAVGDPAAAARAAVNLMGGMKAFVKPGSKVVIKPNMSFAEGVDSGTNTHPAIVRELVAMCREAGASKVRVLDHPLRPTELCVQEAKDACRIFGNDIVHALNKGDLYSGVALPKGVSLKKTDVMKDVLEADVLIAAPVAKSHGSTGVSLSMKGMMGLVWNRTVMHWRYDLHTSIVDLCTLLKPDLVLIDATRVLSTNGPGGPGVVLRPRTVIASRDMVAADASAVQMFAWYGRRMEPHQVQHIKIAHERGLGRMDIGSLVTRKVVV
ncbi:MAG: DUF362 domain-containing protein [Syntrophaceae bacterium]|nr:DUF362 domain-containing protein [Deltaproteobacteria bacterium]